MSKDLLDNNILFWKKKIKAYQTVFETDEGKIVLRDLYKLCKIDSLSYVENSVDKTAFNEGAKYVAHYIRNTLKQSMEEVEIFLKEYTKNNSNNLKR